VPWHTAVAVIVGFAAGLGLMFGLDAAMDKCNAEEDEEGSTSAGTEEANAASEEGNAIIVKASTAGHEQDVSSSSGSHPSLTNPGIFRQRPLFVRSDSSRSQPMVRARPAME
jgi:hypothetical protein